MLFLFVWNCDLSWNKTTHHTIRRINNEKKQFDERDAGRKVFLRTRALLWTIKDKKWKCIRIDWMHSASIRRRPFEKRFTQPYLFEWLSLDLRRLKTWCGADLSVFLKSPRAYSDTHTSRWNWSHREQECYFFWRRSKDKHWSSSRPQFHASNRSLSSN